MSNWNKDIEDKVRRYFQFQQQQLQELYNPSHSVSGSILRMAFNSAAVRPAKLYRDICASLKLPHYSSTKDYIANRCLVDPNWTKIYSLAIENGQQDIEETIQKCLFLSVDLNAERYVTHTEKSFFSLIKTIKNREGVARYIK